MAIDEHAQAAYEAFNNNRRGWRRMPPWDLTLSSDRAAWRAVARAVLDNAKERRALSAALAQSDERGAVSATASGQ